MFLYNLRLALLSMRRNPVLTALMVGPSRSASAPP